MQLFLEAFGSDPRRKIRLSEAPSHGVPIMLHDVKCVGAKTYLALTEEFLERQPKKKTVKK